MVAVEIPTRIAKLLEGFELNGGMEIGVMITDQLIPIGQELDEMADAGEGIDIGRLREHARKMLRIADAIEECRKTLQPDGSYATCPVPCGRPRPRCAP